MNIELANSTLSLPRDGLVALRDAAGTRVTCVSGALWITEDDGERDIVLEAGRAFTVDRSGLTLIMALSPASVQLAERREGRTTRIGAWLARLVPGGGLRSATQ